MAVSIAEMLAAESDTLHPRIASVLFEGGRVLSVGTHLVIGGVCSNTIG